MTHFDDELRALQQQAARKPQLETKLTALKARQPELQLKVRNLEYELQKEQRDVARLESDGLVAWFYTLLGTREEKLDKEQAEAYAARARYETARQQLAAMDADILSYRNQLQELADAEQRFTQLLNQKAAAIKASGSETAAKMLELERQIGASTAQQKELGEAIGAGKWALSTANQVLNHLNDADGWATWDLLGGGTLSDLAKHSSLEEAQQQLNYLQVQLSRFATELADVTIYVNLQTHITGFDRFADFFFDGLLADWNMKSKIEQAIQQTSATKIEIETVLKKLDGMLASEQNRQQRLQSERELLITEATV